MVAWHVREHRMPLRMRGMRARTRETRVNATDAHHAA